MNIRNNERCVFGIHIYVLRVQTLLKLKGRTRGQYQKAKSLCN